MHEQPLVCAQKQYSHYIPDEKSSFEKEGTTMKTIMQSAKKHENILITIASLELNDTYSLFFDLAKYSLWDFLNDRAIPPASLETKNTYFGQIIGLAGALEHLHSQIRDKTNNNDQLICYHMDLKPENIHVFLGENSLTWKIHDFGISKFKRVKNRGGTDNEDNTLPFHLDRLFKPRKSSREDSSGTSNPRYGFTYAAPEAKESTHKVTRKSDVWSLGCIIILILTFMDSGQSGIEDFGNARLEGRDHDRFFDGEGPDAFLHRSIENQLNSLSQNASTRSSRDGHHEVEAIRSVGKILRKEVLVIDPTERIAAGQVENKLRDKQPFFSYESLTRSDDEDNPVVEPERTLPKLVKKRKYLAFGKRGKSPTKDQSNKWTFKPTKVSRRCVLSPSGRDLVLVKPDTISITTDVRNEEACTNATHTPPAETEWADVSLGTNYLCAPREPPSSYFEV